VKLDLRTLLAALLLSLPLMAHAWWDEQWQFRKQITLNTSPAGADLKAPVNDVPVLVRLHTGNFSFADAKEDGSDVRFVAADEKTLLKHHVELWDPVNELALIWVRVPAIQAASTTDHIWLYAGNEKAAPAGDAKGTYDASMGLVLHFNEAAIADASPHGHAVTVTGVTPQTQGPIDGAGTFGGTAQVKAGAAPTLRITAQSGATFSAWVKFAAPQAQATLYAQQEGANAFSVGIAGTRLTARANGAQLQSSVEIAPGAWHHVAAVLGGGKLVLYVDGNAAGEAVAAGIDVGGDAVIGAGYNGDLDEVQVALTARSADWIRAAFAGQGAESKLVAFGQDEAASGGGHSYFNILLSAVTLDGWVVIGILMVMMVVSFVVMITKTLFVVRSDKANQLFMEGFQENPERMLEPGQSTEAAPAPAFAGSSLFRLYRTGLRELGHRFQHYEKSGQPRALSPQAMGAIRSSLDATIVREQARLNNQMVLLTIAISGGPFLGLLGTVVGVMITFAAIAAAGDVNVNSIAPGIAAALVATVAGLAVAIPALFGYNYLASRIKNISNDMAVFADELVNRMAEKYAP
jgi:biopolymer transport protein ExbB